MSPEPRDVAPATSPNDTSTTSRVAGRVRRSRRTRPVLESLEGRTLLAAGSIQFGTAAFSAADTAGTVPIVMTRTGGSTGAVSVTLATSDGTAVLGDRLQLALRLSQLPRRRNDRDGESVRLARPGREPAGPDGQPDVEQPDGGGVAGHAGRGRADDHPRRQNGRSRRQFRQERPGRCPAGHDGQSRRAGSTGAVRPRRSGLYRLRREHHVHPVHPRQQGQAGRDAGHVVRR